MNWVRASDAVQMVRWIVDQKGFFDGQVLILFFVHITDNVF